MHTGAEYESCFVIGGIATGGMLHFLEAYYLFGGIFCNRRHVAFLEAYYLFGGIFCNRRHAAFLEAYYLFGGIFCNRRHAAFLEAYYLFGDMPWILPSSKLLKSLAIRLSVRTAQ